ncbi:MAG: hypothetical protein KatS3mg040_1714 [Candidatus Kapaibacterium sp.]|nr:MAG: hypothetical protein KatS3mg040_1714 [Candidatus Kapabacteria bacterium]
MSVVERPVLRQADAIGIRTPKEQETVPRSLYASLGGDCPLMLLAILASFTSRY